MSFDGGVGDRGVKRKGPTTDPVDDSEPKSRGRACTACRAIKVRCDNPNVAYDGPCSRCTRLSLECVYHEKKRGRKPKNDHPEDRQHTYTVQTKSPAGPSHSPVSAGPQSIREFAPILDSRAPRPSEIRTGSATSPTYAPGISASPSLTVSSTGDGKSASARDDAKMYTLANIMSNKSPGSQPHPEPSPTSVSYTYGLSDIDRLEDPVQAGFVTLDDVDNLFYSYFAHLNSIIGLLDPRLHTSTYVRQRSTVLFTTILAVSSKFFLPHAHGRCHALSQSLIGRALAADMCNIEYIQALSLSTFYKDADDSSSWRKVGLAIRMAYELNLHEFRRGGTLSSEEIEARKQLNRERTWIQLVLYDFTTASQRNKPNMIPDQDIPDVEAWVKDHPRFPCYADAQLCGSMSFLMVYRLIQATRTSMMTSKPGGFDPTIRHLFRMLDSTPKFWATLEDQSAGLAPVSKSIMRFYYFSTQLSINELQMLALHSPTPDAAHVALMQCKDSATLVLKHVVEDMAPSGYIPYTQDGIAFATAYAGVWLYKHLSRFESVMASEIIGLFRLVMEACNAQSQNPKDIPSYFAKFFSHLVRNSELAGSPSHQVTDNPSGMAQNATNAMFPDFQFSTTDYSAYVPPELMPPLDGMDAHWVNVMNGLDDWWKNYTYLGSLSGYTGQ
ncbi:Fungal Zn(2)-Cys(6) binuclear cluster domain [Ceratobasidium sp. AG-Ba]|nr:Fungal Zn(2)-Cys(6) binuclear cluster domain [Ceratobasidium sp. AG-Ba]